MKVRLLEYQDVSFNLLEDESVTFASEENYESGKYKYSGSGMAADG